jgi:hypothetical protein
MGETLSQFFERISGIIGYEKHPEEFERLRKLSIVFEQLGYDNVIDIERGRPSIDIYEQRQRTLINVLDAVKGVAKTEPEKIIPVAPALINVLKEG